MDPLSLPWLVRKEEPDRGGSQVFEAVLVRSPRTGKDCVAVGSDLRFGVQLQTMTTDRPKIHKIHDKLYLGLSGLGTDTQTLLERLTFRHNLYKLREERNMKPVVSRQPFMDIEQLMLCPSFVSGYLISY